MTGSTPDSTKNEIKHEVKDWGIEYLLKNSSVEEEKFKEELTEVLDSKLQDVNFSNQTETETEQEGEMEDLDREEIVQRMNQLREKVESMEG